MTGKGKTAETAVHAHLRRAWRHGAGIVVRAQVFLRAVEEWVPIPRILKPAALHRLRQDVAGGGIHGHRRPGRLHRRATCVPADQCIADEMGQKMAAQGEGFSFLPGIPLGLLLTVLIRNIVPIPDWLTVCLAFVLCYVVVVALESLKEQVSFYFPGQPAGRAAMKRDLPAEAARYQRHHRRPHRRHLPGRLRRGPDLRAEVRPRGAAADRRLQRFAEARARPAEVSRS